MSDSQIFMGAILGVFTFMGYLLGENRAMMRERQLGVDLSKIPTEDLKNFKALIDDVLDGRGRD